MSFFRRHTYRDDSDEDLLKHSCAGESRAFAVLYERYGQRMYRFFYRMMWRDSEKAADMTQDLFLKVLEKAHLFNTQQRFSTWIYAIASNMCKNEYRKNTLAPELIDGLPDESDMDVWRPEMLDQTLFDQHLKRAIDQLEEPHKQCFVLRYQESMSVREISEVLDCPEGTVKSRLHHALRKVSAEMTIWKK
jgi:RNA polymerase sigma-70 factor (ECF subfamily)